MRQRLSVREESNLPPCWLQHQTAEPVPPPAGLRRHELANTNCLLPQSELLTAQKHSYILSQKTATRKALIIQEQRQLSEMFLQDLLLFLLQMFEQRLSSLQHPSVGFLPHLNSSSLRLMRFKLFHILAQVCFCVQQLCRL